jgi:hypothetical protein
MHADVLDAALRDTGYLTDTDSDTPSPRPHDEVLGDAIRVLTEAARLTNTPMRQTSTGTWEPDPTAAPLPIDWAAFVTLALSAEAELASTPTPGPRTAMRRSDRPVAVMARRTPWILRGMARLAPATNPSSIRWATSAGKG